MDSSYTRTTIVLPESLLHAIKQKALDDRTSIKTVIIDVLSESFQIEKNTRDRDELAKLSHSFVGVGKWNKNHPNWKNKGSVSEWFKNIREEW